LFSAARIVSSNARENDQSCLVWTVIGWQQTISEQSYFGKFRAKLWINIPWEKKDTLTLYSVLGNFCRQLAIFDQIYVNIFCVVIHICPGLSLETAPSWKHFARTEKQAVISQPDYCMISGIHCIAL
jgi:hypothetical protein